MLAEIDAAVATLVKKGDFIALQTKLYEYMQSCPASDYLPNSYAAFVEVTDRVKVCIVDQKATEDEVNALIAELDACVASLKKKADFSEIDVVLLEAKALRQSDYTEASWGALVGVLDKIAETRALSHTDESVSADDVSALMTQLNAAIDGLVGFADYTKHDEYIAKFNSLDKSLYTTESIDGVQAVIDSIDALKAKKSTTAQSADEALDALKSAIAALDRTELKTEAPTQTNDQPAATGKGGCNSALGGGVIFAALLLCGACAMRKKDD